MTGRQSTNSEYMRCAAKDLAGFMTIQSQGCSFIDEQYFKIKQIIGL